jgi:hypothetical protein
MRAQHQAFPNQCDCSAFMLQQEKAELCQVLLHQAARELRSRSGVPYNGHHHDKETTRCSVQGTNQWASPPIFWLQHSHWWQQEQGSQLLCVPELVYASMLDEKMKAVTSFIKQKGNDDGEVYATRIMCSLTRQELRDKEKGGVDLPSNTTKHELYEKFCFDRGWAIESDNKCRYPKLKDYTNRMADDMFWPSDAETSEVCSWFSFRKLWKEHCGHIGIRRPCNDTCGECTIYHNAFRYQQARKKMIYEDEDSDDDDDGSASDDNAEGEEAAAEAVSHLFKDDGIIDDIAKYFLTEDCLDQERILEAVGHHVLQAKGVRYYIQKATKAAIMCRSLEVVHKDREYVIVCDYAHNMPLPHYGGEQPGEIPP